MLIKSDIEIITQLKMHLLFDDDTEKSDILKVGDMVDLTFRHKFKKQRRTGKITKINYIANLSYVCKELDIDDICDAVLEVDFSDQYQSDKIKIPVYDIFDFNKVNVDPNPDDIDSEMNVQEDIDSGMGI